MWFSRRKPVRFKLFASSEEACAQIALHRPAKVLAGQKEICLVRLSDGFYAVDNACPHQGAPLSEGKCLQDDRIECPFHRYTFDLRSGKDLKGMCNDLKAYPVELRPEGLFIDLNDQA